MDTRMRELSSNMDEEYEYVSVANKSEEELDGQSQEEIIDSIESTIDGKIQTDEPNSLFNNTSGFYWNKVVISRKIESDHQTVLDGNDLKDIPAVYKVPTLQPYEMPILGVFIDKRIVPGFKYRVRPIDSEEVRKLIMVLNNYFYNAKSDYSSRFPTGLAFSHLLTNKIISDNGVCLVYRDQYLFDGKGLVLQNIGRGYSRRMTFKPFPGQLNNNPNYFWADSRKYGFAFQIEILSVGEKYTICDISHDPIGHLEIIGLQYPQVEINHRVLSNHSVEKSAHVHAMAKVEWFNQKKIHNVSIFGTVIGIKSKNCTAKVSKIVGAIIGEHSRRTYTLLPGTDNKKRCINVSGSTCNDVPISYSLVGLEIYELPVIGTYVDQRILPGFNYRIRPLNSKHYLFDGRPLLLTSIGMGYSKRLTFASDKNQLNWNLNYFWTDSWPNGFGFELRAVHYDMKFDIFSDNQYVGYATVFRVDTPQYEEMQHIVKSKQHTKIIKYVHVDMVCVVTLTANETEEPGTRVCNEETMRISGTAVLRKRVGSHAAKVVLIENIGLESQLSLLFFRQHAKLTFRSPSNIARSAAVRPTTAMLP